MAQTDTLARLAVEPIEDGMVVGLGTGRAASRGIRALAERVKEESLRVRCVATSDASAELAKSLGLQVVEFSRVERVDYLFDGADEVAPDLSMMKGRGGAMTREKLVAHAADRCVYLVDESKMVSRLGEKAPLPIEFLSFAQASILARLRDLGLKGEVRKGENGEPYRTDNGLRVLDAEMKKGAKAATISRSLDCMLGVLGHGLFLDQADEVLVETQHGDIRRMTKL